MNGVIIAVVFFTLGTLIGIAGSAMTHAASDADDQMERLMKEYGKGKDKE